MKSQNIIKSLATTAVIAGLAVSVLAGEEKEETIPLEKVPKKVKATLAKYAADTEVKHVEKGDQDGKMVYEFDVEQGAHKFEVAISAKGKFMGTEEDVEFKSLPEAAQKSLTQQANGGQITGCEKAIDAKNRVSYEAEISKDGKKFEVSVDPEGKVVKDDSESKEKAGEKSKDKD
ncbi:MAG TPA: PepSY-like domain-containing protein [Verrucomicrobiae bacterium]|jgi:hypothetical protein|nr:PepSY-like domain-containing protein [Verrucomicrobiae bacterium]